MGTIRRRRPGVRTLEQRVTDLYNDGWHVVANIASIVGCKSDEVEQILKDKGLLM